MIGTITLLQAAITGYQELQIIRKDMFWLDLIFACQVVTNGILDD